MTDKYDKYGSTDILKPIDLGNDTTTIIDYGTNTLDLSNMNYTYSLTGSGGAVGANNSWDTITLSGLNGTSGSIFNTTYPSSGIHISEGNDITIGDRSLTEFMDKVEQRLCILQPKPELLEKYEALKQAYEHYRTLEALCMGDPPKDPNGK